MDAMDILPLDRQPKLMFLPHIVSAMVWLNQVSIDTQ